LLQKYYQLVNMVSGFFFIEYLSFLLLYVPNRVGHNALMSLSVRPSVCLSCIWP